MPRSRRNRGAGIDIWPGFVDALTQLTMVIVFVLLIFTLAQFYLSGAVSNRDAAIVKLTAQINELSAALGLEKTSKSALEKQVATLNAEGEKAKADITERDASIATLNANMDALKQQLADLSSALDLVQGKDKDQESTIADLTKKLNLALANKVEELARYRSEFFGKLMDILGDRPDIRVVGDRFVFQSEVLFGAGSADLNDAAKAQLTPLADALKDLSAKIPPTIHWVLEVDGHTDKRRISNAQFPSNWELSTARAVSVLKFLIDQGIPADHLAAAGFGEYQPLDPATTDDAYRKNRRIELKLTQH